MIELRHLRKEYEGATPLEDVNITINSGDIIAVIGPSGTGKSTLLRCINMLETPTSGEIVVDGQVINDGKCDLNEVRKKMGMVFQSFNLFGHLTVIENIMNPQITLLGRSRQEAYDKAMDLLNKVGLWAKALAYPDELSGGQQQRIAIARALATDPKVLLCDEATSALDPKTTHAILDLIREINKKLGITVIVITHQMSVVQEICNRVAILEHGTVVEEGTVTEVFANPRAQATRNLINPADTDNDSVFPEGGQRIRVIFNGAIASREPLIAKMAVDCNILASILGASTRSVGDKAYGYILLDIPGTPEDLAKAVSYLSKTPDVTVQVEAEYAAKEGEE